MKITRSNHFDCLTIPIGKYEISISHNIDRGFCDSMIIYKGNDNNGWTNVTKHFFHTDEELYPYPDLLERAICKLRKKTGEYNPNL